MNTFEFITLFFMIAIVILVIFLLLKMYEFDEVITDNLPQIKKLSKKEKVMREQLEEASKQDVKEWFQNDEIQALAPFEKTSDVIAKDPSIGIPLFSQMMGNNSIMSTLMMQALGQDSEMVNGWLDSIGVPEPMKPMAQKLIVNGLAGITSKMTERIEKRIRGDVEKKRSSRHNDTLHEAYTERDIPTDSW